jgi:asparagine synthase (glutamine-hydrolysing)
VVEEVDNSHGAIRVAGSCGTAVEYERMCGFAGIADPAGRLADLAAAVRGMASTLLLRGPDDEGFWHDPSARVALGFRRLAIQDLSEGGRQPMHSASGRYTVVFNGEVYNFKELRSELTGLGHAFRGGSDTEVMLAAFESWGVEQSLRRFNGMFAIALWDARDRTITLIRDRIGVKPLYWGLIGPGNDLLAFGSELKAIDALPLPRLPIDRVALSLFVRFGYVPSPFSIRSDVRKLQPGHLLRWHHASGRFEVEQWWSAKEAAERGSRDPVTDYGEACDLVEDCVRSAVAARLVADVPVGAFLSGGIDSSLMVALAAQESSSRVKTFTIGFEDPDFNEASHAAAIAKHLGTDHTELYIAPRDGLDVLPLLADVFDEPFADSSAIPTYIVARLARQQVKVGLSGDGGDELFGGYERYAVCRRIERGFGWMPHAARRAIGMVAAGGGSGRIGHGAVAHLARLLGVTGRSSAVDRLGKFAAILAQPDVDGFYPVMASIIKDPLEFVVDGREGPSPMTDPAWRPSIPCRLTRMMHADAVSYLPEEILTKTDRLTMANSLEGRDPYCDYRLVELAFRIPASMKMRGGVGKVILRDVLARHVPRSLNVGRKMGFGVPLDEWLRGPLRPWVEETLSDRRLRDDGFFKPAAVRGLWDAHLSGQRNAQWELWVFLSFSAWMDRWNAGAPTNHG